MKRRYYRVKKVYPKQKWLINNNEITVLGTQLAANSYQLIYEPITQNPSRTESSGAGNVTSASILKVGRFRFKGYINQSNDAVKYIIGISYIPEGYTLNTANNPKSQIGESFFYKHPEWVIAWTRMDYFTSAQSNEIRLSSRLKRNLNSGDGIIFFVIAINVNESNINPSYPVQGTVSYVCRTN